MGSSILANFSRVIRLSSSRLWPAPGFNNCNVVISLSGNLRVSSSSSSCSWLPKPPAAAGSRWISPLLLLLLTSSKAAVVHAAWRDEKRKKKAMHSNRSSSGSLRSVVTMDAIPCAAAAATSKPSSVKPALHRRCWTPFRQAEPTRNGLYRGLLQRVTGVPHH